MDFSDVNARGLVLAGADTRRPAAAIAGFTAWKLHKIAQRPAPVEEVAAPEPVDQSRIGWEEVSDGMMVNLDIGYGLVPLADERRGAPGAGQSCSDHDHGELTPVEWSDEFVGVAPTLPGARR